MSCNVKSPLDYFFTLWLSKRHQNHKPIPRMACSRVLPWHVPQKAKQLMFGLYMTWRTSCLHKGLAAIRCPDSPVDLLLILDLIPGDELLLFSSTPVTQSDLHTVREYLHCQAYQHTCGLK